MIQIVSYFYLIYIGTMLLKNNFISVDWGTTNLRIRLVSNDKFKILKEKGYDLGLKKINSIWKEYEDKKQPSQEFILKKLMHFIFGQ